MSSIDEKFFNRIERLKRKQIEEKIEELRLEQILNALPDNKIMTDKHAVAETDRFRRRYNS